MGYLVIKRNEACQGRTLSSWAYAGCDWWLHCLILFVCVTREYFYAKTAANAKAINQNQEQQYKGIYWPHVSFYLLSAWPWCTHYHCRVASSIRCIVYTDIGKIASHSVDFPGFNKNPNSNGLCCSLCLTNYLFLANNLCYSTVAGCDLIWFPFCTGETMNRLEIK